MLKKTILAVLAFNLLFSCSTDTSTKGTEVAIEDSLQQNSTIEKHEIAYSTDSTTMNGFVAYDTTIKGKRPGVLVVHEWWGHNDYARKRAEMLAGLGYVALAVDMYGNGKQAAHPADASAFSGEVVSNMEEAKARFAKAIETLKSLPEVDTTKIAAVGYCFGGSIALSMANAGFDLDAVAAFHAGLQLPVEPSEDIKAKILICNGADDPFITTDQVELYKSKMDAVGADYKYIAYEGTVHAFTNPDSDSLGVKFNLPLKYNKESDEKSWEELKELLKSAFN